MLKGHCAQDWITCGDPNVLRGGFKQKVPPCFASQAFLFVCLAKQALHASKQKNPALRAGLFCLCPGLDSNQHILANAAT